MNGNRSKPHVFLSHCKKDESFIKRLADDLRHCHIEPWLDTEEIRHGQPWLEAIFGSGIPDCDCVLVYLTSNSISSTMVQKEIDASLVRKLHDNHVLFLPYVSEASLRGELRADIQTLQVLEWNTANYERFFPRVVAEIWRGFKERSIVTALNVEKVGRLEAELEIERIRKEQGGIFTRAEDKDFRYIWNALDRWEPAAFREYRKEDETEETSPVTHWLVNMGTVVAFLAGPDSFEYHERAIAGVLEDHIISHFVTKRSPDDKTRIEVFSCSPMAEELLMFGFIERRERPQRQDVHINQSRVNRLSSSRSSLYTLAYTQKLDRLKYWLAVNGMMPAEMKWRVARPGESDK